MKKTHKSLTKISSIPQNQKCSIRLLSHNDLELIKKCKYSSIPFRSASPAKFYDLPDLWAKKGTSLGYGNKMDLGKQNVSTPAPGDYKIKSAF